MFCIKSLIELQVHKKEGVIFFLMNIVKFFDKECIYNVMQTLHDIKVNKKAARL